MITIKIKGVPYNINTSWRDVTYGLFKDILSFDKTKDNAEFIALVSGLPYSTIKNLSAENVVPIINLITFVNDFEVLNAYNIPPQNLSGFKVGSETWYKLEKAKQAIKAQDRFICSAGDIIKIYTGEDITAKKLTEVWGLMNFFLDSVNAFFEKYKELNETEEDPDEYMAGVQRFERFGFFASCVELSRKMGITYNEVLNMTANEVYETFLYDFIKAQYQKALTELRSKK